MYLCINPSFSRTVPCQTLSKEGGKTGNDPEDSAEHGHGRACARESGHCSATDLAAGLGCCDRGEQWFKVKVPGQEKACLPEDTEGLGPALELEAGWDGLPEEPGLEPVGLGAVPEEPGLGLTAVGAVPEGEPGEEGDMPVPEGPIGVVVAGGESPLGLAVLTQAQRLLALLRTSPMLTPALLQKSPPGRRWRYRWRRSSCIGIRSH